MGGTSTFVESSPVIVEAIAAGASIADAAVQAGVAERTVKNWLTRGRREPESQYGAFAARVDELRAERELPVTGRMDEAELFGVVSGACRKGSVAAMKLLWEMLRVVEGEGEEDGEADPLREFDELAARRAEARG